MDILGIRTLVQEADDHGISLWVANGELHFQSAPCAMSDQLRARLQSRKSEIIAALSDPDFRRRECSATAPIIESTRFDWEHIRLGNTDVAVTNGTHSVVSLGGKLDVAALQHSVEELVQTHRILGARVVDGGHGPQFVFDVQAASMLRIVDLSAVPDGERQAAAGRALADLVWSRMDIERGPLFQAFLVKMTDSKFLVGFVVHHFISDHASIALISKDLASGYRPFHPTARQAPRPLPLQYAEYAMAVNEWLHGPALPYRLEYWRGQLHGACITRLPPDFDSAPTESGDVEIARFTLGADICRALRQLAREEQTTVFVLLLAAKMATLSHLTGSEDITVMAMYSGRADPRLSRLVGATANIVALRTRVPMRMPLAELIRRVRDTCDAAYRHNVPYGYVGAILRECGASHVFPFVNFVNLRVLESRDAQFESAEPVFVTRPSPSRGTTEQYSSHWLQLRDTTQGISGAVGYSTLMYSRQTIDRMVDTYSRMLELCTSRRDIRLSGLLP
jgi:hypothetical protein